MEHLSEECLHRKLNFDQAENVPRQGSSSNPRAALNGTSPALGLAVGEVVAVASRAAPRRPVARTAVVAAAGRVPR